MEKEIKAKTMKYGTVAVLLAILLAAVAYNFGVQPIINPKPVQMNTFSSLQELEDFLKTGMQQASSYSSQFQNFGFPTGDAARTQGMTLTTATPEHSTTNVQVAGVDEADIVKTDGTYLYIVSGSNVFIVWANAFSQTTLMHKIALNNTYDLEIYVSGDKLAILGGRSPVGVYLSGDSQKIVTPNWGPNFYPPIYYSPEVFIKIYDITNRMDPVLTRSITVNGSLGGSRMIGNYVYLTTVQSAVSPTSNQTNFEVALPKIAENDTVTEVQPTEIRYISVTDISYFFTTIIAVNVMNDEQAPTHETFLAGSSSTIYVSLENMYLTIPDTNWFVMRPQAAEMKQETLIYRIRLDQDKVTLEADGSVPGFVLNQFSMDEYNGFFRIATQTWLNTGSQSNLYVLDMTLTVVGSLENLAPGESLDSARFMGDRAYLSTSVVRRDPFFVIDVANPSEPKVLGYLKIPGFNRYLHPYDETHIIGIGRDGTSNVKISLFDVGNVSSPIEIDQFAFDGSWSDTPVLQGEHKAFLFEKTKDLLAMPVRVYMYDPYNIGWYVQVAQVFNITLTRGIQWRGSITHQTPGLNQSDFYYYVNRVLYIDSILYTVSNKKVKMNSLVDLSLLNEVTLT